MRFRRVTVQLVRGQEGGDKQYPVELKLLPGPGCQADMAPVDRVEGASKDPHSFAGAVFHESGWKIWVFIAMPDRQS